MKNFVLLVAIMATFSQGFAQANCSATAPLIQPNANSIIICNGTLTPSPVLTDTGSVLPNLEYVLVNNSVLIDNSPIIIASNTTGIFDIYSYDGIENGDEVCIIPVRFNLGQVSDVVEKIINGSYSPGVPCCNLIELLLDNVCSDFAAFGVTGGSSVTGLDAVFDVVEVLSGEELTIERFVATIGTLNQNGAFLPEGCGGGSANIPICYALDATQKACYIAGFRVTAVNEVYIDSAAANGSATVTPTSGVSPFSFDWSNGITTATVNNLAVGTYTVTITDDSGCDVTETIEVLDSCALLTYDLSVIPVSCYNGSDALIQIEPIGGTPDYVVTPQTGTAVSVTAGNRGTFISLSAGTYNYTVADNGGCATSLRVNIVNPDSLVLEVLPLPDTLDLDVNDTLFYALDTVYGGDFPVNILWDFGNGTTGSLGGGEAVYTAAGNYTIEVLARDSRNCLKTYTHNLTVIGGTGINENKGANAFKLYPNPSLGIFTVELSSNTALRYSIYATSGQQVQAGTLQGKTSQLDCSTLPHGVYFLKAEDTNAWVKLVIVK